MARIASIILLALALVGCGTKAPSPIGSLNVPGVRGLAGLAWLPNGQLVSGTLSDDFRYSLVDVNVATGQTSPRPAPSLACPIDAVAPRVMPPDRVAFAVSLKGSCKPMIEIWSAASDGSDLRQELTIPVLPGAFFPLRTSDSWVYDHNTGLCAWIATAPKPLAQTLGITVPHDGGAIPLDAAATSTDCDRTFRAALPTLRSDGLLAFVASPASLGLAGGSRLDAEWLLYSARAGETARQIRTGITHPIALEWDPTGRRLGLTGLIDGIEGLWLIDESGTTDLLAQGRLTSVDWSPDGQRIATLREGSDPLNDTELVFVDIPH